jgi:hypothetical protein
MITGKHHRAPSTHRQIMTKMAMAEIQNGSIKCISGYWIFGNWNLFGIWSLDIGD